MGQEESTVDIYHHLCPACGERARPDYWETVGGHEADRPVLANNIGDFYIIEEICDNCDWVIRGNVRDVLAEMSQDEEDVEQWTKAVMYYLQRASCNSAMKAYLESLINPSEGATYPA